LTYLPTAYLPIPIMICTRLYKMTGWLDVWGIFIAELILVFRTWAIWGKSSKLALSLLAFLCCLAIPTGIIAYIGLNSVEFSPSPSLLETCWVTKPISPILFIDYVIIVAFESVVLALTLYKGLQHLRQSSSSLIVTLYRDGVLYYTYLIGFSLLNIVVLVIAPKPAPSLILMQRDLHSILTGRILLNLREAACRDRAKTALNTSGTDATTTSMDVTHPWTAFSSIVIGVDTWFRGAGTEQGVTNELV